MDLDDIINEATEIKIDSNKNDNISNNNNDNNNQLLIAKRGKINKPEYDDNEKIDNTGNNNNNDNIVVKEDVDEDEGDNVNYETQAAEDNNKKILIYHNEEELEILNQLKAEEAKHKNRAERFGISVAPVDKEIALTPCQLRHELVRERTKNRQGFFTGVDFASEEEKKKQENRAQRFQLQHSSSSSLISNNNNNNNDYHAESEVYRNRSEKFGIADKFAASLIPDSNRDKRVAEQISQYPATVQRRAEACHIHGCDFFSTFDILTQFSKYGVKLIEWVNDSSCNLVFEDKFSVERLLSDCSTIPLQKEIFGEKLFELESSIDEKYRWRQTNIPISRLLSKRRQEEQNQQLESDHLLLSYLAMNNQPAIIIRQATINDIRPAIPNPSRYRWLNNNNKINKNPRQRIQSDNIVAKRNQQLNQRRSNINYK